MTSLENSHGQEKEFYKRKDKSKTEHGICLPRYHPLYRRSPYLHHGTPRASEVLQDASSEARPAPRSPLAMGHARGHGQSLVVNGGHVLLLWKFGRKKKNKSAQSSATQRKVLRCRVSNSLLEGLKPQAQTHSTQGNCSRKSNIRAPILENMISALQQRARSRSLGSPTTAPTAPRAQG